MLLVWRRALLMLQTLGAGKYDFKVKLAPKSIVAGVNDDFRKDKYNS